jgi:hypothetical protein
MWSLAAGHFSRRGAFWNPGEKIVPDLDMTSFSQTRRALIAGLAAAAGSAAIAAPAPVPPAKAANALGRASLADWSRLLGSAFVVDTERGRALFQLVAVRALINKGTRPATLARSQAFETVFESALSAKPPAGDRVYRFTHAQQGSVDLFVGPATLAARGRVQLGAVFN